MNDSALSDAPLSAFEALESNVRNYSRRFPAVFERAEGYLLFDETGRSYLDFFSGAGALNYGHNNRRMKRRLIEYLERDGVTHSLDMATGAKRDFLEQFAQAILRPRNLSYRVQFTGPTGASAVEAALKLARKATGRRSVVSFVNGYHGLTLGALAVTSGEDLRASAGVPLAHNRALPFDNPSGGAAGEAIARLRDFLRGERGTAEFPAAVIVETVQAEGGVHVASVAWLRELARLAREFEVLLIVDDIQMGCGRAGTFFSFEAADINPDIVCLSKSISGFGLPMALVLVRPALDVWRPGEDAGTFRGNNLAFVTATEALSYWRDDAFSQDIERKSLRLRESLTVLAERHRRVITEVRGRGLIYGLALGRAEWAPAVSRAAFERGLLVETAGAQGEVLKLLPPLIIDEAGLDAGVEIIEASIRAVCA